MAHSKNTAPRLGNRRAYIDGLRGLLAVCVFNAHLTPIIILGYDRASGHDFEHSLPRSVLDVPLVSACVDRWTLFTIPILKLAYSGSPAVSMFFAISGYVLSMNWIYHAPENRHVNKPPRALGSLSSSTFRRPLRLLLSSMASMVLPFLLSGMGYLDGATAVKRQGLTRLDRGFRFGLNQYELFPQSQATWWAQTRDVLQDVGNLLAIFAQISDKPFTPRYNPALWTVKADLRASLVLLATQVALLEVTRPWRLRFLFLLATLGMARGSLECPLFWAGYIIAELHYSADHHPSAPLAQDGESNRTQPVPWPLPSSTTWLGKFSCSIKKHAVFILGCYLASYPTWEPSRAPLLHLPSTITAGMVSKPRTWHSLGAVLMLYSMPDIPLSRRLAETHIAQFLGRCSFSFYLVHVCTIASFGPALFSWMWGLTGYERVLTFTAGFAIAYMILLVCVLMASVVFHHCIEVPISRAVDDLYGLVSTL